MATWMAPALWPSDVRKIRGLGKIRGHEGPGPLPETIMEAEYTLFVEENSLPFGAMFHFHVCWMEGISPYITISHDSSRECKDPGVQI